MSGEKRTTSALSNSKSASTVNKPTMDGHQMNLKDAKGASRATRNLGQHTTETKGFERGSKNKKVRPQTSNQEDLENTNFRVRRVKINKNASSSVKVSIGSHPGQNTYSPKKRRATAKDIFNRRQTNQPDESGEGSAYAGNQGMNHVGHQTADGAQGVWGGWGTTNNS